jgi:AcrR family transcriptional regulator
MSSAKKLSAKTAAVQTPAKPVAIRRRPRSNPVEPATQWAPELTPPASLVSVRTYRLLMTHAMRLVSQQRTPSVAELAHAAGVSRATAYRYFPSRSKLISAVVGEGLASVRSFESSASDGVERMHELFEMTFPLFVQFEPHMRAALQLSFEHHALERSGLIDEEPFRRGHRRDILSRTTAPLRQQLGAAGLDRLIKALSLIYGIEPYVVLKDIWGCKDAEVESIARWMVDALLAAALNESAAPRPAVKSRVKRQSRKN